MVDPSPVTRPPRLSPRRLLLGMLALSALGHALFGTVVLEHYRLPDLELDVEVPIDVELGMTEAVEAAPPPPPPAPPPEPPPAPKAPKAGPGADAGRDAALDAAATDAALVDAADAELSDAAQGDAGLADAQVDAGPPSSPSLADAGPPGARLPPGAQIALRIDMTRIRESPLAGDVRLIVAAIPDWKALLDGSQIDPVDQLDRLLLATPNLQREKVVIAGRYLGGRAVVDRAVQSMAKARGVEAVWRNRQGIPVAPWANADATPRVIALVGPTHFTISREADLDRVLAIAAARAARGRGKRAGQPEGSVADALLSMEEREGISLEVEGVEQFIRRGKRGIPQRLRVSATEVPGPRLMLRGRMAFADADAARDALAFWSEKRDAYARNALVAVLGLAPVLKEAELLQLESELQITLHLSVAQARLALGYVASMLGANVPAQP
jgi:hypothetical protein